jgi:hypothetical protein
VIVVANRRVATALPVHVGMVAFVNRMRHGDTVGRIAARRQAGDDKTRSHRKIAARLFVSPSTVEYHVREALRTPGCEGTDRGCRPPAYSRCDVGRSRR